MKGVSKKLKDLSIRNVAIIAHVDHGKTTLVDEMLKQSGTFRENQAVAERVMDSGDIERERGITILAKNTSISYKDVKINIIDTPGHADFGGEVERILKMVSGVVLLVDAAEGPMPQTRFVLERALALGHRVIIVVNKIDRPDARLDEIGDELLELLFDLDANEEQIESPVLFCSARAGTATFNPHVPGVDLTPLFDTILDHIPAPEADTESPLQMLVSSIDYSDYVGRIGIGRIETGILKVGAMVQVCDYHSLREPKQAKITAIYQFEGLTRVPVEAATAGNIVCFSGVEGVTIGDTLCAQGLLAPLPFVKISDPTMEMTFSVNNSPFAGQDGKLVTTRNLRDRLQRELLKDVSLHVGEVPGSMDSFSVAGRGEMHLSILMETMRREGYEFQVSTPRVIMVEENGVTQEPIEEVTIDVPEAYLGAVMEKLGSRRGEMTKMTPMGSRMRVVFLVPSRGLFGYRNEFLTDTRGEGILSAVFHSYAPLKGEISRRSSGSLIAHETGEAVGYGLFNAQERGTLFIDAGTPVYEGMVVGMSPKAEDITVNVCKRKQLTNMRASGSDDSLRLTTPRRMSLEQCLEFLADDELLEVTPHSLRIRKRILQNSLRMKAVKGK